MNYMLHSFKPSVSDIGDSYLPPIEVSNSSNLHLSEFELLNRKELALLRRREHNLTANTEKAKAHSKNFTNKADIAQLTKCLILDANNSPATFKASHTVSLGKSTADLLTISKIADRSYFQKIFDSDKVHATSRVVERTNSYSNQGRCKAYNSFPSHSQLLSLTPGGTRQFGRLISGTVEKHDPSKVLKYSTTPVTNFASRSISLRKQNIHRNLASYSYLASSCKAVRAENISRKNNNKFSDNNESHNDT